MKALIVIFFFYHNHYIHHYSCKQFIRDCFTPHLVQHVFNRFGSHSHRVKWYLNIVFDWLFPANKLWAFYHVSIFYMHFIFTWVMYINLSNNLSNVHFFLYWGVESILYTACKYSVSFCGPFSHATCFFAFEEHFFKGKKTDVTPFVYFSICCLWF